MAHHLEARLAVWEINGSEIDQHVHLDARVGMQETVNVLPSGRGQNDRVVPVLRMRRQGGRREGLLHEKDECLCHGCTDWAERLPVRERLPCCGGASPPPCSDRR